MTYVIWSFQRCTTSQVQHNDWEKWFQTLVVTALITYSALSPFLLSLALPSSLPLFSSVSYWLHSMARHLSRCHPPYGFLFPSLCVKQWKQDFSVQSFFPLLFRLLTPPLLLLLTFATDSSLFQAYWKGKLVHVVLMIACSCENSIKVTRVATNCAMVTCVLLIEHFIGVHMLLSVSAWSECI